jgi:hypothetical protein
MERKEAAGLASCKRKNKQRRVGEQQTTYRGLSVLHFIFGFLNLTSFLIF